MHGPWWCTDPTGWRVVRSDTPPPAVAAQTVGRRLNPDRLFAAGTATYGRPNRPRHFGRPS
ncbi:hypothetical protein [Micromonospora tulbaghiae]|uniref:hypothetical protein n=1 Tax=Micromonospora tulbaghiae TaxID=479978 RepID=UPI003401128D